MDDTKRIPEYGKFSYRVHGGEYPEMIKEFLLDEANPTSWRVLHGIRGGVHDVSDRDDA